MGSVIESLDLSFTTSRSSCVRTVRTVTLLSAVGQSSAQREQWAREGICGGKQMGASGVTSTSSISASSGAFSGEKRRMSQRPRANAADGKISSSASARLKRLASITTPLGGISGKISFKNKRVDRNLRVHPNLGGNIT